MAPEQARGVPATPATDVYGVGVVLYEMLAGHPPFEGTSMVELAFSHVHEAPPPLPAHVPAALVDVVDRALAKDPRERFQDGRAMARALAAAESDSIVIHRTPAPGRALASDGAATALLEEPPRTDAGGPPSTRVAAPYSPRRNVNPSGRRRRAALLGFVLLLGAGMVAAAIALAPGRVRVPELRGFSRARADATLRHDHLTASFENRYSHATKGTVIGQDPGHGIQVKDGTAVRVTLSAGPAPVSVPSEIGQSESSARAALEHVKLRARVTTVPAPGVPAGQVTAQSPHAGAKLLPEATVALSVAEAPAWRDVTGFSGLASGSSVPFRIRGTQWRMVYDMGFNGSCALIFICSGPSATVTNVNTGARVKQFDLYEGTARVWTFNSGPGQYEITITPGSDNARWSVRVQDYY
jgi:serine/threonine-protein kinase